VRRWYQLEGRPFRGSLEDAAAEFRSLFTDSVRLRLRADVPVGSCLSGGLDSSSIVCIANQLLRSQGAEAKQRTFSACAKVKRYDERDYIDEVVGQTGVQAHYVYPELSELFDTLDAIAWHQDEPFGSTSIYAQWHVFKLASEARVKVLLDGQGADELLAATTGSSRPTSRAVRLAALGHALAGNPRCKAPPWPRDDGGPEIPR
jgi:asparagine synthase (glutamine-hydrolysing)